jgi:anti-sigma regulatory factor (Ser/Thr protein kinase)
MRSELSLTLSPDTSAPSMVRRAAERHFADALSCERLAELALVVSELVTNAVVHGHGEIVVKLRLDAEVLRGDVIDQGGGFERAMRERRPHDVGGRGLMIVEALTARWGIHEGTTHVWFELPVAGAAPGLTKPLLGKNERPDSFASNRGGQWSGEGSFSWTFTSAA